MADYSDDSYEDEFVDADLPNLRTHGKFDDNIEEGSDLSSSLELPAHTYQTTIPEVVKFVTNLLTQIRQQNASEIHYLYENHFNRITDKLFKQSPWPHVDVIKNLPNSENSNKLLINPEKDAIFLILYKELYYRHIYSKLQPTTEQRFESWQNYCDLFAFILKPNTPADIELQLPNQWLWDIVDEFIYQFQSFSQYRSKLKNKAQEELQLLKAHPEVWNVDTVISTLSAVIAKSKIVQTLESEKKGEISADDALGQQDFDTHILYKMIGYFSIISLLRMHCLLGDYYLALRMLEPLDITKKGLHTRVTACHITLYYYLGFSYLMMRRYSDAIKTFSTILLYINRTKQYHTRSYQYDEIVKKNEQMYALLAITVSLCPQRIDENVHSVLREKYTEKMQRMQRGDLVAFEEVFAYACPKFIIPSAPNYQEDTAINYNQEALRLQQKLFLNEVRQQTLVTTIRSYLKLYSTISTSKLTNFLKSEEQGAAGEEADQIRTVLLCYKHKTRNLVWNGGSPLSGKWTSSSDVDFYVDKDMVHIVDAKVTRRYGEYFIRNINKFEEIIRDISGR